MTRRSSGHKKWLISGVRVENVAGRQETFFHTKNVNDFCLPYVRSLLTREQVCSRKTGRCEESWSPL